MALGIMISGLMAAAVGTVLAIIMGLDLSSALIVYGIFGVAGGILACLAGVPMMRNLWRQRTPGNRTLG